MDPVLVRHPVIDLKTGLVTPEWASWFASLSSISGEGVVGSSTTIVRTFTFGSSVGTLEVNNIRDKNIADDANIAWSKVSKLGASLSDLGTVNLAEMDGELAWSQLPSGVGTWHASPSIFGPLTVLSDLIPGNNYSSDIGEIGQKFLAIHAAELWVETLVAQETMATIGGRVLVAPTTTLTAPVNPSGTSIQVKHSMFAVNDIVRLESNGSVEFMLVTAGPTGTAGYFAYTVTRNLDGSGANSWVAGDAVVNTGVTGDGFIDIYALTGMLSGSGPTIVGNVRTGAGYSDIAPRWAIGNLNGLYGYASNVYGFAAGDPSGAWVKVDPTNGLRLGHDATTHVSITAAGAASLQSLNIAGTLTIQSGGEIVAGGVTLDDTGLFIDSGSGSGGAGYDDTRAVRWTTGSTSRTAIWKDEDTGSPARHKWLFENISLAATPIEATSSLILRKGNSTDNSTGHSYIEQFGDNISKGRLRMFAHYYDASANQHIGIMQLSGDVGVGTAWLGVANGGSAAYPVNNINATTFDPSLTAGFKVDNTTITAYGNSLAPSGSATTLGTSTTSWSAIFERNRSTALGTFTNVAFNAANFTASGSMTWTVASGDVATYQYALVGKTMTVVFYITGGTTGGTAAAELRIAVPGGFTVAKNSANMCRVTDTADVFGMAVVTAGGTQIRIFKDATFATNYGLGAGRTAQGFLAFEVQ